MLGLFAGAILAAALLLFLIQPMAAKIVLPKLGGAPSVWIASMLFFQAALLLGYFYTHILSTRLRVQVQLAIHAVLLLVAAYTLPPPVDMQPPTAADDPVLWLLRTLAITVGLPFFVIATTSPLLQRWFSYTGHPSAKDPYFLYAASNIGNIAGLLVYPFVLEPLLGLKDQTWAFSIGFGAMLVLVLASGFVTLKRMKAQPAPEPDAPGSASSAPKEEVSWGKRIRWTFLAFVPSSLLLGVTLHITTDIGSLPLLWSIPLLLYLLSFVLAFSTRIKTPARKPGVAMLLLMLPVAVTMLDSTLIPSYVAMLLHVCAFGCCAWMCHKLLSDARPSASALTDFYLCLSVGGVLGGLFNGLLAPRVFDTVLEYPLMLAVALLLVPGVAKPAGESLKAKAKSAFGKLASPVFVVGAALSMFVLLTALERHILANERTISADQATMLRVVPPMVLMLVFLFWPGPRRAALALFVLLSANQLIYGAKGVLHTERTFFGVHRVTQSPRGSWRKLVHGTTNHGIQQWLPESERVMPRGYYMPQGPAGDILIGMITQNRVKDIAILGMGAGGLAAYGQKGMTVTFFEIDPAVMRIAGNPEYFTFVYQSPAKVTGIEGDGRIMIAQQPEGSYDVIMLDAFSSDAVPMHLLTVEAFKDAYLPRLRKGGVITVQITNRYYDLSSPLARIVQHLGLAAMMRDNRDLSVEAERAGQIGSTWMVIARDASDLEFLRKVPGWRSVEPRAGQDLWTDDRANLLGALKIFQPAGTSAVTPAPTAPATSVPPSPQ